jgi:hypothetical protein
LFIAGKLQAIDFYGITLWKIWPVYLPDAVPLRW